MAIIAAGADKKLTDLLVQDGIEDQFGRILSFWDSCTSILAPKLLLALAKASGSDGVLDDVHFNYRMVDYYERAANQKPPRCGEHRDFGTLTVIFAEQKGLEVFIDGEWRPLEVAERGSAHVVFGWCTEIFIGSCRVPVFIGSPIIRLHPWYHDVWLLSFSWLPNSLPPD